MQRVVEKSTVNKAEVKQRAVSHFMTCNVARDTQAVLPDDYHQLAISIWEDGAATAENNQKSSTIFEMSLSNYDQVLINKEYSKMTCGFLPDMKKTPWTAISYYLKNKPSMISSLLLFLFYIFIYLQLSLQIILGPKRG